MGADETKRGSSFGSRPSVCSSLGRSLAVFLVCKTAELQTQREKSGGGERGLISFDVVAPAVFSRVVSAAQSRSRWPVLKNGTPKSTKGTTVTRCWQEVARGSGGQGEVVVSISPCRIANNAASVRVETPSFV